MRDWLYKPFLVICSFGFDSYYTLLGSGLSSWGALASALGEHLFMELDGAQRGMAGITSELNLELQNGRLLRLLVKLSMVTERPENDAHPQWAETGVHDVVKREGACSEANECLCCNTHSF